MDLPKITKGDLVLLSRDNNKVLDNFLFYSDGRVAKTDFAIDRFKIRDEFNRIMKETVIDIEQEKKAIRLLIDEAVERGFLVDYLNVFGRDLDKDRTYGGGIEYSIIRSFSPITIFGYEGDVIKLEVKQVDEFRFGSKRYSNYFPNPYILMNRDYITATNNKHTIKVGSNEIKRALIGSPLECYVNQDRVISNLSDIII